MKRDRQFYSDDERILRIWAIEDIKDLMSRRAALNADDQRREELSKLWVSEEKYKKSASFGRNWGYYVGMDEISNYYVVQHTDRLQKQLDAQCEQNDTIKNIRDNFGYGNMTMHHVSTPMVILSGDGYTAQGTWYSIGVECMGVPGQAPKCMWYCEKICADFVLESSGDWKIWHLFISNDVEYEAGTSLGEVKAATAPGETIPEQEFSEPTEAYLAHDRRYAWSDGFPRLPEPYFQFNDDISFGYEGRPIWNKGHPNYRKEDQR